MKRMAYVLVTLAWITFGGACAARADAAWLTDFAQVKKAAAEKKLPILADFSGSDWCGWCIKLDREVFAMAAFQDYAKTNLVLFLVDFPRKKTLDKQLAKQNEQLAQKYGVEGFPTIILMDATGKELARTGYQPGGAAAYVEHLRGLVTPGKPAAP